MGVGGCFDHPVCYVPFIGCEGLPLQAPYQNVGQNIVAVNRANTVVVVYSLCEGGQGGLDWHTGHMSGLNRSIVRGTRQ
ncbi:hypothetical protein EBZ35_05045 [bacterium]|nr:hypothetical protein [bacterium]